ncbi:unnamed protein product [Gadus morhua 'NCC']
MWVLYLRPLRAPEGSIFTTHFQLQSAPSAPCWVAPSRARTAFRKESAVGGSKAGKWSGKSRQRGTSARGQGRHLRPIRSDPGPRGPPLSPPARPLPTTAGRQQSPDQR